MKKHFVRQFAAMGACSSLCLLASRAGASNQWWDPNGTSAATSGTWDNTSAKWTTTTSSNLTASTVVFTNGNFPEFAAGTAGIASMTITVNSAVTCVGIGTGLNSAGVTNLTFSGSGSIGVVTNAGTLLNGGFVQGFFCGPVGAYTVTVDVPITGAGGVQQHSSGSLALYGTNSYAGGTALTGGQLIYYNNNYSFGSGPIYVGGNGNALVNSVASALTITNNFDFPTAGYALNLAGGDPVAGAPGTTFAGSFLLPSSGLINLETSSTAAEVDEISGVISGSGGLIVSDAGAMELAGTNTYSGSTTVSSPATLVIVGAGNLGGGIYAGTLTNASKFIYASSTPQTLSGVISGAGTLTVTNNATLILNAADTYTGVTTVSNGVLVLGAAGSINSSPTIALASTGILDVSSNASYTLSSANTLNGVGTVNGVLTVGGGGATGGTVVPGSSTQIGTLNNTGSILLQGGGTNVLNVQNATSGAGVGNNLLSSTGNLGVLATSAHPFVLKLDSLTASGSAGAITNYGYTNAYTWTFATGTVTNYTPGSIVLNLSSFTGTTNGAGFYVTNTGASLAVVYQPSVTPVILSQSPSTSGLIMAVGQSYGMSVTAGGLGPLTYQWYTNGVADTTGTGSGYTVTASSVAYSGTVVECVVSNANEMVTNTPVTVTVIAAPSSAYSEALLSNNPVAYWPMHEVEGAAYADIETNYGTLGVLGAGYYPDYQVNSGAFIRQSPGALTNDPDTAVFFTGPAGGGTATNGLFVPHTSSLSTLNPPFTVESWFMATNIGTGQGDILSQGDGTKTVGLRLYYQNTSNDLVNLLTYDGAASGTLQFATGAATSNQWHHLVLTCDAQTNMTAWWDGAVVGGPTAFVGEYQPDNRTPFTVGTGLGNTRAFHGLIDEVAVYTNVIADINQHYIDATNGADGVYFSDVTNDNAAIYLRMDAPNYTAPAQSTLPGLTNYGSVFNDSGIYSAGAMPGVVPGPMTGGAGLSGYSGFSGLPVPLLGGVSGYAMCINSGLPAAYNPVGRTAYSISAMFRGNPADNRIQTILGHSTNSWTITMNTNGTIQCQLGTNLTSIVLSHKSYNDGNWHQLVEVYTPSAVNATTVGTNALYIDGVLSAQTNNVSTNGIEPGSSQQVMIGADPSYTNNPTGLGRQFAGAVCEVALYTNALPASAIHTFFSPPTIGTAAVTETVSYGTQWTLSIMSLSNSAAWSDPSGNALTLSSVGPTSALGTNVTTDGAFIYYGGAVTTNDSFSYVITDGTYTVGGGTVNLQTTTPEGPAIGAPAVTGNGYPTFSGNSIPGFVLGVEFETNVAGPWYEGGSTTVGTNGFWTFTDSNQVNPATIFYRLYYPDNPSNPPQ